MKLLTCCAFFSSSCCWVVAAATARLFTRSICISWRRAVASLLKVHISKEIKRKIILEIHDNAGFLRFFSELLISLLSKNVTFSWTIFKKSGQRTVLCEGVGFFPIFQEADFYHFMIGVVYLNVVDNLIENSWMNTTVKIFPFLIVSI